MCEVDGVFVAVGIQPNSEAFRGLVDADEAGYLIAGEDTKTSHAGIFAAGDVRTKMLRQIITATADGANAITAVQEYLLKVKIKMHPGHFPECIFYDFQSCKFLTLLLLQCIRDVF